MFSGPFDSEKSKKVKPPQPRHGFPQLASSILPIPQHFVALFAGRFNMFLFANGFQLLFRVLDTGVRQSATAELTYIRKFNHTALPTSNKLEIT
jgi:hypothetical protein